MQIKNKWQSSLTLDERIELDLTDLYNNGVIDAAVDIDNSGVIKAVNGQPSISTRGIPGHFTGNRSAKTVFVMLNPGKDVSSANNPSFIVTQINRLGLDKSSLNSFISSYKAGNSNFGNLSTGSPFDVKQARFLRSWIDSGIDFPHDFPKNKGTFINAKKAVLLGKLQLELVPYCSKEFIVNNKTMKVLLPFIETLFKEITFHERKYVVFGGSIFEDLFKLYNVEKGQSVITMKPLAYRDGILPGKLSSTKVSCRVCYIKYGPYPCKALIAHTFAHRRLPGQPMSEYGKFCYDEFVKTVAP